MTTPTELDLLQLRIEALQARARKLRDEGRDTMPLLQRIYELVRRRVELEKANGAGRKVS
jgi:hypothetical protein